VHTLVDTNCISFVCASHLPDSLAGQIADVIIAYLHSERRARTAGIGNVIQRALFSICEVPTVGRTNDDRILSAVLSSSSKHYKRWL
jgi:hypothetical protein